MLVNPDRTMVQIIPSKEGLEFLGGLTALLRSTRIFLHLELPCMRMTARLGFPLTKVHARLLAQSHWCGTDGFRSESALIG